MELSDHGVLSEVKCVCDRDKCEACTFDAGAELTVVDCSEGEAACAVSGETVRHMKTHILKHNCFRSVHMPLLVCGDEVFSEFFVYVNTRRRAKQYRTDGRKAADSAADVEVHYKLS